MEKESIKEFKILFQEYQDYYSFLNLKFANVYTKILELSKDDLSYDNLKANALEFFDYALKKRFREEPLKYLFLLFKKHFHKEDINKSFNICNTILNSIDFSLNMDLCNVLLKEIPDLKDSLVNAPNNNLTNILKNTILNSKPLVIDSKDDLDSDDLDWEYIREIKKIPLLNPDEEYKLAQEKSQGNKQAYDQLVKSNLRLVANIAKRYMGRGVPFKDLIQEGNIGLMKAVEKYDYTLGYRFSTYATFWIKQSLDYAIANESRNIRIPRNYYLDLNQYKKYYYDLYDKLGRKPTYKELEDYTGYTEKEIKNFDKCMEDTISLNRTISNEEDSDELENFIPDKVDVSNEVINKLYSEQIQRLLIKILDDYELYIIILRYGLDGNGERKFSEIGTLLGVTRQYINQYITRIEKKLKNNSNIREYYYNQKRNNVFSSTQNKTILSLIKSDDISLIKNVILGLNNYEQELLRKRYSEDLGKIISNNLSFKEILYIYEIIIPKINHKLTNEKEELLLDKLYYLFGNKLVNEAIETLDKDKQITFYDTKEISKNSKIKIYYYLMDKTANYSIYDFIPEGNLLLFKLALLKTHSKSQQLFIDKWGSEYLIDPVYNELTIIRFINLTKSLINLKKIIVNKGLNFYSFFYKSDYTNLKERIKSLNNIEKECIYKVFGNNLDELNNISNEQVDIVISAIEKIKKSPKAAKYKNKMGNKSIFLDSVGLMPNERIYILKALPYISTIDLYNIYECFGYDFLDNPEYQGKIFDNATKYKLKKYIKLAKEDKLPNHKVEANISIMHLCLKNQINIDLLSNLGINENKLILLAIAYQEYLSKEQAILFSLYVSKIDPNIIAKLYNCDLKDILIKLKYCLEIININQVLPVDNIPLTLIH